ncbi:hypothetical protein D9756_007656 [Leucocoprinus leucothites]|uniref:Glutaredoxin domain-containing protein n=1 Tax=Leucocoprinus leucothites TaxID=201217 RepID=A0A8H5D1C7_9AGAR|nr:hypothetical protein D9756_007656 [Leucoagaricus leucothites]
MSFPRRTSIRLFFLICALFGLSWTFGLSWELPESWKDTGILTSSRARIAAAFSARKQSNVDEIYGLLHLVTADSDENQHVLTNNVELDPTKRIGLNDYAAGNEEPDWSAEVERLDKEYPVVVFSKTFCPYSKKAKDLLAAYDLEPQAKVIEVDLRDDSAALKAILTRLTQHSTFPNVLVCGKSLGGWDDIRALHDTHSLAAALEKCGVHVRNTRNIQ